MQGKVLVIVATISFGMGVDKANVRFVAHWNLAKSLASYYQESGRAGRDGLPSSCRTYYSAKDKEQISFLIQQEVGRRQQKRGSMKETDKAAMRDFEAMVKFCEQEGCRHATISKFFGDQAPNCSKACDFCSNPKVVRAQIARAAVLSSNSHAQSREPSGPFGFLSDQYEGGKKGYGFERYDESEGGNSEDETLKRKKEFSDLYKKQMNIRKGGGAQGEDFIPPDADCPLKEASSQRVPRLTVKAREHCLRLLQEAVYYQQGALNSYDFDSLSLAVGLEHEVFRSSKTSNTYKAAVLKKVSEMKKTSSSSKGGDGDDEKSSECESKSTEVPEETSGLREEAASSSSANTGFTSASEVYSMKRKRVGAGLRGSSNPFQTATELLNSSNGQSEPDRLADVSENSTGHSNSSSSSSSSSVTSSIRARANSAAASFNSPTKKGKALSKKQQKLADAAKNSRTISHYFTKKEEKPEDASLSNGVTDDASPQRSPLLFEEVERQSLEEGDGGGANADEDVMVISDDEEEEEAEEQSKQEETTQQMTADTEQNKVDEAEIPQQDQEETPKEPKTKRESSPPAKRSRPAEGSRHVTFNPKVEERAVQPDSDPPKAATLKEAADIVVRCLDPFYTQGRFATKELFKSFARFLSHLLAEGTNKGRGQIKAEAKAVIKKFFCKVQRCESEADWKHLKRPQHCLTTDNKE